MLLCYVGISLNTTDYSAPFFFPDIIKFLRKCKVILFCKMRLAPGFPIFSRINFIKYNWMSHILCHFGDIHSKYMDLIFIKDERKLSIYQANLHFYTVGESNFLLSFLICLSFCNVCQDISKL